MTEFETYYYDRTLFKRTIVVAGTVKGCWAMFRFLWMLHELKLVGRPIVDTVSKTTYIKIEEHP